MLKDVQALRKAYSLLRASEDWDLVVFAKFYQFGRFLPIMAGDFDRFWPILADINRFGRFFGRFWSILPYGLPGPVSTEKLFEFLL